MSSSPHTGPPPRSGRISPPAEVPQYSYGWLLPVAGALVAFVIAMAVYKLHYSYGQAPHRILKILVGVAVLLIAAFRPKMALHAWLLAMPVGEWLPSTGIPGVNGPNLLFVVLLGSWVVPRIMSGTRVATRTRLSAPIGLFVALLFLAVVRAAVFPPGSGYEPVAMLKSVWQSALGFSVYYIVANTVTDRREIRKLITTLSIGVLISCMIAFRQYAAMGDAKRIAGALGDVNDLAAYFAICGSFLIPVAFIARGYSWWRQIIVLGGAVASTVATFLPKSRGAYVGIGVAIMYLSKLIDRRFFIVVLLALLASPFWLPGSVLDRIAETRAESVEIVIIGDSTDSLDPSAAVRLDIWKVVLASSIRRPILGHGYGSIPYLTYGHLDKPWSAHSLYVETIGEMGLVGLVALIWLLTSCFRSGLTLLRSGPTAFDRRLAIGFLAATVALIITNAFGQRLTHVSIAGTYFFMAGFVDRSIALARTEARAGSEEGAETT